MCGRDWSSDVCSSDLQAAVLVSLQALNVFVPALDGPGVGEAQAEAGKKEIGRASCRERV